MSLQPSSQLRSVSVINVEQLSKIKDFLRVRIDRWIEEQPDKWFAARDLVGGENRDWSYPLNLLHEEHSFKQAGIDIGWILKSVLHEDNRLFETNLQKKCRHYKLRKIN